MKATKVANSDNCRIANSLVSTGLPADLDFTHYTQEVDARLAKLQAGAAPRSVTQSQLVEAALKARAKGLVVVPKGVRGKEKASVARTYEPDTIAYWRDTPLEETNWGEFEGFGAYTGAEFELLGIDVDDPEKAKKTGIYEHIAQSAMVAYHGDRSAADVRAGRCRGTFLFKHKGNTLRSTSAQFLKDYGFEILYGKRVVQLDGFHPSREAYRYAGTLTKLSPELHDLLEWMIPERNEAPAFEEVTTPEGVLDLLTAFQKAANEDSEYVALGGCLTFAATQEEKVHLKGRCIGQPLHTSGDNEQPMTASIWNGRIKVSCFHHSCESTRQRWEKKLRAQVISVRKPSVKPERILISEAMQEVAAALADPAPSKLILAPTGSGKSYGIANHIAPLLDADSGNSDKFAIICSSKDEMKQLGEKFAEILDTDNINEYGINLVEASKALYVKKARSISSVDKSTRVAITHYTYASRRRFSPFYYSFLKFIDENTQVFVDEFDAFVDSQTAHLRLGSRWKSTSQRGITKYIQLHKCGLFHGFNNCLRCVMRRYDGYRLSLDAYSNPTYESVEEFTEGEAKQALEHIALDDLVRSKVLVGTNEVWMLEQDSDPGELRFDGDKEPIDFAGTFRDHLKAAYLPTVHRPVILYKDVEINREAIVSRYTPVGSSEMQIPEPERKDLKFPSRVCNVLTVTLIDRRPLARMAQAKSFTALTATLTPLREDFLTDAMTELKKITIEPTADRRMDKIMLVGMARQLPVTVLTREMWKIPGKMLRFRETEMAAKRDYDELKGSPIVTKMGISKLEYRGSSEQSDEHRVLLTYSFGSLGRGIDFGHYDVVNVNASIYKPIAAYVTDDPTVLRNQINEDRSKTVTQNIGRILRRSPSASEAVKIIVIEEMETREEFDLIEHEMQSMSNAPVVSWWVPEFIATEEVCDWLTRICSDCSLPDDLPTGTADIVKRAAALIDQGCSKKELKQKLRWPTTRKRITQDEATRIEAEIDKLLENRPSTVRRTALNTPEKAEAKRQARIRKIRELIGAGKTDGQIRGDMKVRDKKQGWDEPGKQWFETVLAEERAKASTAAKRSDSNGPEGRTFPLNKPKEAPQTGPAIQWMKPD